MERHFEEYWHISSGLKGYREGSLSVTFLLGNNLECV